MNVARIAKWQFFFFYLMNAKYVSRRKLICMTIIKFFPNKIVIDTFLDYKKG